MDLNDVSYDVKFQEMQKYIPFLNDIIDKLENDSSGNSQSNLRGIQLSKINSLKSLLSDKTKRLDIAFYCINYENNTLLLNTPFVTPQDEN